MTSKQPWEGKLFDTAGRRANRSKAQDRTGLIFSILLILFAVLVTLVIGFSIYLSVGGSKNGKPGNEFYTAGVPAQEAAPVEEAPQEETTTAETEWSGNTTAVLAGEGAGQIAARSGITIERLYELNPEHLQTGAWYANPGDVVKID